MELLGTTDAAATAAAAARGREGEGGEKRRNVPRSDAQLARSPPSVDCRRWRGQFLLRGDGRGEEEVPRSSLSLSLCSLENEIRPRYKKR